jgi:uncharacterized protein YndB with AHSA1/START domain
MESRTAARPHPGDPAVNDDAPVVSRADGEIGAPIDDVWRILTTIEQWPTWNLT